MVREEFNELFLKLLLNVVESCNYDFIDQMSKVTDVVLRKSIQFKGIPGPGLPWKIMTGCKPIRSLDTDVKYPAG